MKVSNFYNKNQFIIETGKETYFQSYESTIARIDKKGVLSLGNDWDYSRTTLKHLYLFIEDYKDSLNDEIRKHFKYEFITSKNKKQYIQKLIDNKIIKINL